MKYKNVFDFHSYRDFLRELTSSSGKKSGLKSELAAAMGSHPAYLSRVLSGVADLSSEQAERIAAHLGMDKEEKRYLIFLLEEERAGTEALKAFFREERVTIQQRRKQIKDRIPPSKQISLTEQALYYSAWYHSAIHVLISLKDFQEVEAISEYLDLPTQIVRESIQLLENMGIIRFADNQWVIGERHLHADKSSPFMRQHHINWRLKSIERLRFNKEEDLRYSAVFSISEKDAHELKEKMLRHLGEYVSQISHSPEGKVYAYTLDYFEL